VRSDIEEAYGEFHDHCRRYFRSAKGDIQGTYYDNRSRNVPQQSRDDPSRFTLARPQLTTARYGVDRKGYTATVVAALARNKKPLASTKLTSGFISLVTLGALQLIGDVLERGTGIGADRLNGGQADNDDEGQHHRVFYRGRAIFRYEETLHLQSKTLHSFLQHTP
jgi:hypothetical protein